MKCMEKNYETFKINEEFKNNKDQNINEIFKEYSQNRVEINENKERIKK